MKKIIGIVFGVTVLASSLFVMGCSKKAESSSSSSENVDKISIMFQGSDAEQAAIKATTERFTKETGISVELLYTPHDSYTSKLAGYYAGNKLPDVISIDGPNLASLVWSGYVTGVEPYIDADIFADMTESNKSQCVYPIDNKYYAIGQADSTVLLFANKKYLNAVGARIPTSVADAWTVQEFDEILGKLAALDEVTWPLDLMWSWNIAGSEWGTYAFYETLVSAGTDIINRDTWTAEGTLNNSKAVEVLSYFQKWNKNGWIVPKSAGDNTLYNDKRQSAIAWNGNWSYSAMSTNMGDDLVAIPLPNFGTGTRSPNATWIWGIAKTSSEAKKVAAGKLLSFMMKDTQFLDDLIPTGSFPALKTFAARCTDYTDPTKMAIAYEQAEHAVARPAHPAYPIITMEFSNAFESILNGADIQATLNKAAKAIDDDIADNDGYPPFGNK